MKVEILRQDADGGKHLELSPPCECCRDIVAFITESNHTVIWSVNNLLIDDVFSSMICTVHSPLGRFHLKKS